MKKPYLRVTKWLADIPVEACCAMCPNHLFRAVSHQHRPQKGDFQEQLQKAFDQHLKEVHSNTTDSLNGNSMS